MAKSFIHEETNKKKPTGKKRHVKKLVLMAGVVVAAFGLGIGAFLLQHGPPQKVADSSEDNRRDPNRKPEGVVEESLAKARAGDYEGAQQQLKQELAATEDDKKAHALLLQQSINALNKKEYAAALKYAREAITYDSNFSANYTAAQAAELLGQKPAAKGYYKTALAKYDKNDPMYEAETKRLKTDIERMSQ